MHPSRHLVSPSFSPIASLEALPTVTAGAVPGGVRAWLVAAEDEPPTVDITRDALLQAGFTAAAGSTVVIPTADGPVVLAGLGARESLTVDGLRDAAAAAARAVTASDTLSITVDLGAASGTAPQDTATVAAALDTATVAAALAEGAVLARYRYRHLRAEHKEKALARLGITVTGAGTGTSGTGTSGTGTSGTAPSSAESAIAHGLTQAAPAIRATVIARDLANTPGGLLNAVDLADVAVGLGAAYGFEVEVVDKAGLLDLGCGGILGVNAGSTEEPRMIVLRYTPEGEPRGHLGLVGKGIMYDSGGISLKPSDPMHLLMKIDMGGAAAVLGAFAALRDQGTTSAVSAWLMCTDNMPSGTATKLGDVLVARGGTTVEVKNTDAEGRLVMMDGLVLATEAGVDAVIDIATLTGAAMMALGQARAALFASDDALAGHVETAAIAVDEPVWRMPLERKYRKQLDSGIADLANLGGPYAGATTAALFLAEFVGQTPWAHLDIAGTMQTESDDAWRSAGATGFGARLLARVAAGFGG